MVFHSGIFNLFFICKIIFLLKILTWAKDHQSFCEKFLQPVYDKLGHPDFDARVRVN